MDVKNKLLFEYQVVKVQAGDTKANDPLKEKYGTKIKGYPFLTVLDAHGNAIANQETGSLEDGPKHDPAKVLAFLKQHQAEPLDAEEVLGAALTRAKLEKKRVFLSFEAPW